MKSSGIQSVLSQKAQEVKENAERLDTNQHMKDGLIWFSVGQAKNGSVRAHVNVTLSGLPQVKKECDLTALQQALFSSK